MALARMPQELVSPANHKRLPLRAFGIVLVAAWRVGLRAQRAQPELLRLVRLFVPPPVEGALRAVRAAVEAAVRSAVHGAPAVGARPRASAGGDVFGDEEERCWREVGVGGGEAVWLAGIGG